MGGVCVLGFKGGIRELAATTSNRCWITFVPWEKGTLLLCKANRQDSPEACWFCIWGTNSSTFYASFVLSSPNAYKQNSYKMGCRVLHGKICSLESNIVGPCRARKFFSSCSQIASQSSDFQLRHIGLDWSDLWLTESEEKVVAHYRGSGEWITPAAQRNCNKHDLY